MFYLYNRLLGEKIKIDIMTALCFSSDIVILTLINEYGVWKEISVVMYLCTLFYLIVEFKITILEAIKKYILGIIIMSNLQFGITAFVYMIFGGLLPNQVNILVINLTVLMSVMIMFRFDVMNTIVKQIADLRYHKVMVAFFIIISLIIFAVFKYKGSIKCIYFFEISVFAGLIIYDAVLWHRERTKIEVEKKELHMQEVYGKAFADMIAEIRRKQHNFDNHINAIANMYLSVSSLEELIEKQNAYCRQLVNTNRYNKLMNENSSPVIIGFLYNKFSLAEKHHIKVHHHVVIEEASCRMSQCEMIEILGVVLDNAMEAAEKFGDERKKINFEMIEYKDKIIVKSENICEYLSVDKISNFFDEGYSTKGENRGLGLATVKRMMDGAGGRIYADIVKRNCESWFSIKLEIDR